MAISVLNLVPQITSAKPASGDKTDNGTPDHEHAFQGLLAVLSPRTTTKSAKAEQPSKPMDLKAVRQHLQDVLQRLTGGKVDIQAPGLGLSAAQRDQLVSNLEKLLHDLEHDGSDLLAGLLAASQAAANIKPAEVLALAKLLATSSEGSVSVSALKSNLQLLAQAVQFVANSGGKMTLQQAVQELAPKGDAFANQLAAVLQEQKPTAAMSSDAGPPDTGPPKAAEQASATAGSDGRELTVSQELTSPADGAAQEASSGSQAGQPDVTVLADVLEALIQAQQPQERGSTSAQAGTPVPEPGVAGSPKMATIAAGQPSSTVALDFAQALAGQTVVPITPGHKLAATGKDVTTSAAGNVGAVTGKAQSKPGETQILSSGTDGIQVSLAPTAATNQATAAGQGSAAGQQAPQQHMDGSGQPAQAITALMPSMIEPARAAAAPAPAPETLPARAAVEQAIVDQIVRNATVALRNGQQEFRIQLKPDFLGAMEVRVSVSDGTALVRMSTENAATRQLIDANIGQLRQAFGAGQVRVEHVPTFSNTSASWSFSQGGQQGFWQGQNPYDGSSRLPEAIPYSGKAGGSSELPAVGAAPVSPAGVPASAPAGAIDIQA